MKRKNPLPFYLIPWTVEDWKDFYHTLQAFKDRVRARHRASVYKNGSAYSCPHCGSIYTDYENILYHLDNYCHENPEHPEHNISNLERTCRGMEVEG